MPGQNISFFIEIEGNSWCQLLIDDNLDLRIFMSRVVGAKADQKWAGFVCAILMFNYNGVANSRHDCMVVEGAAEDLSGLHARLKQKHLFVFKKGIIFYLLINRGRYEATKKINDFSQFIAWKWSQCKSF